MTTALLEAEILRFLDDRTPEVLCIRGRWGVGKTYAWLTYLGAAERNGRSKFQRYAYVSLFGLNSLNDLRYAVFESTVTSDRYLTGPDIGTLEAMLSKGTDWGRKARPYLDAIGSLLGRKDAGEALARASFLLVRDQLVCFDDLERAGDGLKQRDLLGLASFLKEQRKCKIVLLLNDEEMAEDQLREFNRQLEKVVDVNLRFDPTSQEAVDIALDATELVGSLLRPMLVKLGIVNIRVIKKIERMARQLHAILEPCGEAVVRQAMATVTLGGWTVLQPGSGPAIDFLKRYREIGFGMKVLSGKLEAEDERLHSLLQDYGYHDTDEMDGLILEGVERGAFDGPAILEAGQRLARSLVESSREDPFSKAWDQFHGNFAVDDDKILDDLYRGAIANLGGVSPVNLDGTVRLLREMGRAGEADDLIAKYVDLHADDPRYFDISGAPGLMGGEIDAGIAAAFAGKLTTFVDERDPVAVLKDMQEQQGWNRADLELLAKLSAADLQKIIEDLRGPEIRRLIEFLQLIGAQRGAASTTVGSNLRAALEAIAAKSPLRALRMRRFGIGLMPDGPEGEVGEKASRENDGVASG